MKALGRGPLEFGHSESFYKYGCKAKTTWQFPFRLRIGTIGVAISSEQVPFERNEIRMSEQAGNTTIIQGLLDRLATGDESAKDELIKHSMERLRRLARKMLRDSPAVRRWNETDDVFQNALIRLDRALQTVRPESTRRFIGLAATQIRRELMDLARHHYGPQGDGAHHASDPGQANSQGGGNPLYDPGAKDTSPSEIPNEDMERFHAAVDDLPDELREVFEKSFYLDMTQDEIAKEIGVSTKTIKRRWRDAKLQLEEILHPGSE